MLSKIYNWFVKYDLEINWFMIGWFLSEFFQHFSQGRWLAAVIDITIVVANVVFRPQR